MGADKRLNVHAAGGHRISLTAIYGILRTGALELGEIARMEVEIQKRCSLPPPQAPHCPSWHGHPSAPPPPAPPYFWPH